MVNPGEFQDELKKTQWSLVRTLLESVWVLFHGATFTSPRISYIAVQWITETTSKKTY